MKLDSKRKKLYIATALLLVCTVLLGTASYAWISLATAPEVTGIATNIGSNGNLEIALLNGETYTDPSKITAGIGTSMEGGSVTAANESWGSLVNLADPSYGLSAIELKPSRLNVTPFGSVRDSILMLPNYNTGGRVDYLSASTVSAVYDGEEFIYSKESLDFGVRAIGQVSNLSMQESALLLARTNVKAYRSAIQSEFEKLWKTRGAKLIGVHFHRASGERPVEDLKVLEQTAKDMQGILQYVELAIRQSIIGYLASTTSESEFATSYNVLTNSNVSLAMIMMVLPEQYVGGLSLKELVICQEKMKQIEKGMQTLQDSIYTSEVYDTSVQTAIAEIFSEKNYWGDKTINEAVLREDNVVTITQLDAMGLIARFVGDYEEIFVDYEKKSVEIASIICASQKSEAILVKASKELDQLETEETEITKAKLTQICGYVVDMAFRTNATSKLLLQTEAVERDETGSSGDTEAIFNPNANLGGGSYLRFSSATLTENQLLELMDAIRIGFVDRSGTVVALAKGTMREMKIEGEEILAPIFLYDYSIGSDGSIRMEDRKLESAVITELTEGVAEMLTIVVWLDGDYVGNSVAGISEYSISGTLNLQFASDVELRPAPGIK